MNRKEVYRRIELEYYALARIAARDSVADDLLRRAYDSAEHGERERRRLTGRGYAKSVHIAAKYFVVKWVNDPAKITDALSACLVRPDVLLASALLQRLTETGNNGAIPPHQEFDYSRDIVGGA